MDKADSALVLLEFKDRLVRQLQHRVVRPVMG